jgi:glycosyltransferase involved in cell wall biosynthesis
MGNRILFIHDGPMYVDNFGRIYGIHLNDRLIQRYRILGNKITFLTRSQLISKNKDQFSEIKSQNFNFISIPNFKSISKYYKIFKARSIINEAIVNNDIIIIRQPSASGSIAVQLTKKYNKPYIIEFVACTFDAYWYYNWKGKLIAPLKYWQQKNKLKDAKYVIYVTEKFLQRRYPTKARQISCSNVELDKANDSNLEKRLKKIRTTDFTKPLILGTVAALNVPYKAQSDVIKAISKLKKQGIIFKYQLVGQGDQKLIKNYAQKYRVSDLIDIIGPLRHCEVFKFMENIDIYIHPSKQEGLPRAIIEAMSMGCPVLGANTAGIPELINKDFIFNKGDITKIYELLTSITAEKMLREANNNFSKSRNYEKDKLQSKREDFYMSFLTNTKMV